MCLEDIKIAKSKQNRSTSLSITTGSTVTLLGFAANRVYVRIGLGAFVGAVGNLNIIVQFVGDSTPIGIGMLSSGNTSIELWLERHSHFVKGPFWGVNSSGFTVAVGLLELLQNTNPEDAL